MIESTIPARLRAIADEIEGITPAESIQPGWRPDGFSDAISPHGGRRFVDVDDALAELEQGDRFAKKVAESAARWFAFDLVEFPELDPGTDALRAENLQARKNARGPVFVGSFPSHAFPFRLDLPASQRNPFSGIYYDSIDDHAWCHIKPGDTPAAFCARYAIQLLDKAASDRAAAKEADAGVVRPDQDERG